MRDSLIRSRKWIYVGLAVLALASLFLPTMMLRSGDTTSNFWINDIFTINAWFAVCWFILWLIPVTVIVINSAKGGDNAVLNTVLFSIGIVLAFAAYPIFMKLIMLQGEGWSTISFFLGIGGILNGTFLVLGLLLAIWSIVDIQLAARNKKSRTVIETTTTTKKTTK